MTKKRKRNHRRKVCVICGQYRHLDQQGICEQCRSLELDAYIESQEQRVEDGQQRWGETGSTGR